MRNTTFINDFTPSLHESLFNKAQKIGARKAMERYDACMHGKISEKGPERLFAAILFGGIMRAEYANSKIRDAISDIREDKSLNRHEIKRLCNIIRNKTAKFDTYTVRAIGNERYVEFYDELTGSAEPQFDKLYLPLYYSMLQFMTRHEIKHGEILAKIECAAALLDFSSIQYKRDVNDFRFKAPGVMALGDLLTLPYAKDVSNLLSLISREATRGRTEHFDVNEDKNVRTAANNLFNMLGSPDAMNNYLVLDESLIPDRMKQ